MVSLHLILRPQHSSEKLISASHLALEINPGEERVGGDFLYFLSASHKKIQGGSQQEVRSCSLSHSCCYCFCPPMVILFLCLGNEISLKQWPNRARLFCTFLHVHQGYGKITLPAHISHLDLKYIPVNYFITMLFKFITWYKF